MFILVFGTLAEFELLDGTGGIMIGNPIKEQFLGGRSLPRRRSCCQLAVLLLLGLLPDYPKEESAMRRDLWLWTAPGAVMPVLHIAPEVLKVKT